MMIYNWLVVSNIFFMTFHKKLGISSSQLTHIFQRARSTTNDIHMYSPCFALTTDQSLEEPMVFTQHLEVFT